MFESLFQALFSYRPVVFQQGEFRFDVTAASLIATLVVAVVVGLAVLTYRRVRVNEGRLRDRIILTSLRVAALALVLFCLFRPTLIVRAAVNQQNVVAVLLDDSAQHADSRLGREGAGRVHQGPVRPARQPAAQVAVGSIPGAGVPVLVHRDAHGFGEGADLQRIADQARRRRSTACATSSPGLPVAGVVLVTDGADTSDASLDPSAAGAEGPEAAGVHGRRRQRAAAARRPDRSRQRRRGRC